MTFLQAMGLHYVHWSWSEFVSNISLLSEIVSEYPESVIGAQKLFWINAPGDFVSLKSTSII